MLEHEYGHTLQLEEMGLYKYLRDVASPSFTYAAFDASRPYGTYHGAPWEHDPDKRVGITWPGTDPRADDWSEVYFRATAEQKKYYRDYPQSLILDAAAFNTKSSYTLEEYEYQKRMAGT